MFWGPYVWGTVSGTNECGSDGPVRRLCPADRIARRVLFGLPRMWRSLEASVNVSGVVDLVQVGSVIVVDRY
ncbi:hypothetical protein M2280_006169 [Prescottella agglutinans]|jgi:hypothetical protein|uniref:Uncharacterized protein n=1 Tax=Prescottella agglutinans TaxID=1644129 RepID=A0ABT6MKZ6_9NOCA|nr:hypothetical protein [Prescottella agglutinans]